MQSENKNQNHIIGKQPHESLTETNLSSHETTSISDISATDGWPRFLVMESLSQERPLSRLSPFVVEKAMKGLCDAVSVKKLGNGDLLIRAVERKSGPGPWGQILIPGLLSQSLI